MNDNTEFLPENILYQLADRVAMKVDYISSLYTAGSIWEESIEPCKKIEADYKNVSTVIIKAKEANGLAVSGTGIKWFQIKLTLIYILLYYKHDEDAIYKRSVFPQLVKNMGAYAGDNILRSKIHKEINEIKEEDRLNEQEMLKLRTQCYKDINIEPCTENYSNYLAASRKEFIQKLNDNQAMIDAIDWADATVWFNRDVMTDIFWGINDDQVLRTIVNAIITTWNRLDKANDRRCYHYVSTEGDTISRLDQLKFGGLFGETIDKFFNNLWAQRKARVAYLALESGNEATETKPISSKQDINPTDNKRIELLEAQVSKLEAELKEAQTIPETITAKQKVRMELTCQLMEKAGITKEVLEHHGNKDKAGTIMGALLEIPSTTCKVYVSQRDISTPYHKETIDELNPLLMELGTDIKL